MVFSDSHCHIVRASTRLEHLVKPIEEARAKKVSIIVSMAMDLQESANNVDLTQHYPELLPAIGIHPWNAIPLTDEVRRELHRLANTKGVTCIGEIGLDYARNPDTKEIQKELLRYELYLAKETGLPVSMHCRDAHQDMMDILAKEKSSALKGSVHGFSGDQATLKDWLNMGFCVSIGGRRGVPNEVSAFPEIVGDIPLDRLLTESEGTDGTAGVVSVAERLASLRGVSVEKIADTTTSNMKRLLKL
ncbi:MAG: TatD family hydrolase [Chloroflexi bacterium]|nr:TatD family hydrolase [Chloroflexota bacterium]